MTCFISNAFVASHRLTVVARFFSYAVLLFRNSATVKQQAYMRPHCFLRSFCRVSDRTGKKLRLVGFISLNALSLRWLAIRLRSRTDQDKSDKSFSHLSRARRNRACLQLLIFYDVSWAHKVKLAVTFITCRRWNSVKFGRLLKSLLPQIVFRSIWEISNVNR